MRNIKGNCRKEFGTNANNVQSDWNAKYSPLCSEIYNVVFSADSVSFVKRTNILYRNVDVFSL